MNLNNLRCYHCGHLEEEIGTGVRKYFIVCSFCKCNKSRKGLSIADLKVKLKNRADVMAKYK